MNLKQTLLVELLIFSGFGGWGGGCLVGSQQHVTRQVGVMGVSSHQLD